MNLIKTRNILIYLSMVGFFFFPFYQTHLISLVFLLTFFTGEFKHFLPAIKKNKIGFFFLAFFIIHLLSLLYSKNINAGWKGIEVKLSYLAFPLFFPVIFYSKKIKLKLLFQIMVISGIIYCLSSFSRAGFIYLETHNFKDLISSNLGFRIGQTHPFVHPTYVSVYYNFLILYLSYYLLKKEKLILKTKILIASILLLFLVFILFSTSKFGILLVGVNSFLIITYYAIVKNKTKQAILFFSVFSFISVIGIYNSPVKGRFQEVYDQIILKKENTRDWCLSTETRLLTWKASRQLIKENILFGVGIGDIRKDLDHKYQEMGFTCLKGKGYDSHQQFLQTFATIGVSGIICLLFLFFILFRKAIKTKNIILFSFTLFYFLFGLTESMLETQAGIVFFTFMSLLLFQFPKEKLIEN